jgi:hypothetical protein
MAISKERRSEEGPVIPIMLALLAAGIAAVILVVRPAHSEYTKTRHEEDRLRQEIAKEEDERSRLELLARGLDQDPRIMERVQRNAGAGKPGEIRYVRATDSRPASSDPQSDNPR